MIANVGAQPVALYSDTHAINSIKYQDDQGTALKVAAQQFEAMLYQQLLTSMRAATDLINKESGLSNQNQGVIRDMYDGQLALHLSQGGKGSISEMLVQQLMPLTNHAIDPLSEDNRVAFQQVNNVKEIL